MTDALPPESKATMQLHAMIDGHVQGVGYRHFVAQFADKLDLTGWVRNTYTGNVEVLAEGPRVKLEALLIALKHGPRGGYVIDVTCEWAAAQGEFHRFSVNYTA